MRTIQSEQHFSIAYSRHVFLSPHPDDAIWSCGGLIDLLCKDRQPVSIITVFDSEPDTLPSRTPLDAWRAIARPRMRRMENENAMARLNADHVSLNFVDAALRNDGTRFTYDTLDDLFHAHVAENDLRESVAQRLQDVLLPGDLVHAPLAAGNHPDHRIVRSAIEGMRPPIVYYDDFPYPVSNGPQNHIPVYLPIDIRAWMGLAMLYRSQVRAIFGTFREFKLALVKRAGEFGRQAGGKPKWAYRMWFKTADA